MDLLIYQACNEYKQKILSENDRFVSAIISDDFRYWLWDQYAIYWDPNFPNYVKFNNTELETIFRLKFS